MTSITQYVAGFLFDKEGYRIALIEKQRPDWQRWKLNGIGGHIERNRRNCMCYENDCDQTNFDPCICPWETPAEAMRREFCEETGVEIDGWKEYIVLSGRDWVVHFFYAFDNKIYDVRSLTDEKVLVYNVDDVVNLNYTYPVIANLRWLIPMALTMVYEPNVNRYTVQQEEVYAL